MASLQTAEKAMFGGLIDYAGLFPPASLDLDDAVAEYRAARIGSRRWMLGRFIITADRLEELAGTLTATMTRAEEPWALSVILKGDLAAAAVAARAFDSEMNPAAQVALLEIPLPAAISDGRPRAAASAALAPLVTTTLTASPVATPFFEISVTPGWSQGIGATVAALADQRAEVHRPLGAKLRCGGLEPAAFPNPEQVVEFISQCVAFDLPFKATAGLHHAVRHHDDELGLMRHGFLNLLAATAMAVLGAGREELTAVVAETDPSVFAVGAAGLRWRDRVVRIGDLVRSRSEFAAYGSCSFDEPVRDLETLGFLGVGPA